MFATIIIVMTATLQVKSPLHVLKALLLQSQAGLWHSAVMPEPKAGIRAVFMVSGKPDHRSVSVDDSLQSIVQVGPTIIAIERYL